jgi:cytoskeletal protein RodZ
VSALGEEFRVAREARGLSLSDVAERLHIRSVYLAAIEDEDWHVIGAPVYVRGFMRTYARFLGLDAEAAVARFSAAVPPGTPAASSPRTPAPAPSEKMTAERSTPSLAAVLSVVVAVVAVLFVAYEFYQYRTGAPSSSTVAQDTSAPADLAAPLAEASSEAVAEDTTPPVASALPKLGLKRGLTVHVTESSWLRVAVDGTVVYEGILPAGSIKSFHGKAADVRVGNAGGVRIAVNGKTFGPLGASGDVVERKFVLSGK